MSLKGNCVLIQSGGPTAVINASACGVIQQALNTSCITSDGNGVTQALRDYVIPLMQGEVKVKMAKGGLPEYTLQAA